MRTNKYFSLLVILILLVSFISCKKDEAAQEPEELHVMRNQLDQWGDSLTKNIVIDSVNVSIQGAIFYVNDPVKNFTYLRGFGSADISTARFRWIETEDLFRIGTLTNTFTTTVFLQLVQSGVLNLDSKLNIYFPEVLNSENITLRQIAGMTSGLYDFSKTDSMQNIWAERPLSVLSPEKLLGFINGYSPSFPPGDGCDYSLTNSLLQGMIIEKVTEDPLQEHYRKRIFEPLSLSDTKFPTNQFMPFYTTYSHGYEYAGIPLSPKDVTERYDPSWGWSSANLISGLPELQTWIKVLVDGTLLDAETQQERMKMTNWKDDHGIPLQYGLGILGTSGYFGHTGDVQGYRCIVMFNPVTEATIIIMMNNGSGSPLLMFAQIANLLTPGLIPLAL